MFNIIYNISIYHYLIINLIIFIISIIGILINKNNLIILFLIIEIILISINTNFIIFSYYLNNILGQIFVFFILIISASEISIGLSILILIFYNIKTINIKHIK